MVHGPEPSMGMCSESPSVLSQHAPLADKFRANGIFFSSGPQCVGGESNPWVVMLVWRTP